MKKKVTVFLAAAMVFALTACSGGNEAKAVYDDATKKTSELTSIEATSLIDMKMAQGKDEENVTMDLDMKMVDLNTENMRYLAEGKTSVMGQNVDLSMYYEGGYYYMETAGQKIKYAMDLDEMMKQIKQSTENTMDSSYMKKLAVKKDGENQVLTFTVDASKMETFAKQIMEQLGTGAEGVTYTIKSVDGEATVNKDGYITAQKVNLSMEMTLEGQTITIDMVTDTTYKNPGQQVEVTAPDLEGYTEVDPSALQAQ